MIITRVELRDYGAYEGTHIFEMSPVNGKPVVLVGGVNGAGKTTLFESVMLCLYGMSATGLTAKKEYHRALAGKIHRGPGGRAGGASISVKFLFFHGGAEQEYLVERAWTLEGGAVDEELNVSRGPPGGPAGPLDTVERAHWQSFVGDLVPRGIAGLFFFDGEKVSEMARGGTEDEVIRGSFSALLGLDLVEQLREDLQVNAARRAGGPAKSLGAEMEHLKAEHTQATESAGRLREARAAKQGEAESVRKKIEVVESKITRIGGGFAGDRSRAMSELASKKAALEAARKALTELCAGALPLAMAPRPLRELADRLRRDEESRRLDAGRRLADARLAEARARASQKEFWHQSGVADADAAVEAARSLLGPVGEESGDTTFGFSPEQAAWALGAAKVSEAALGPLGELADEVTEIGAQVAALEKSVASAPRDDEVGRLVSEAGALRSEEGRINAEIEHIEQRAAAKLALARHAQDGQRRISAQIRAASASSAGALLSVRVQDVLAEFSKELRAKKIRVLEGYLLDALAVLLHKKGLVEGVRVNPETFAVSLLGESGAELPRDSLSTGEKQMLATAVLWALAKTSGRPLPFMIDTPLARLDAAHRDNIVEKFLPAAAHQVVVFSTDTEIDREYHSRLLPHISRAYAMEHDGRTGATRVHEGYFWKEGKKVVAT